MLDQDYSLPPINWSKAIVYKRPSRIDLSDLVDTCIYLADIFIVGTYKKLDSSEELLEALEFRDWLIECNLIRYYYGKMGVKSP